MHPIAGRSPHRRGRPAPLGAALAVLVALATSACTATVSSPRGLQVVASTDVYGAIARAVAGPAAQVTSLIDDASQDPHAFAADARDQLAVARADVVVANGGGYDDSIDTLLRAVPRPSRTVIHAVDLSQRYQRGIAGGAANEHVFYDLATMARLAGRLAAAFAAVEPRSAASFAERAQRLRAGLADLERAEAGVAREAHGTRILMTEPVAGYLVTACGLVDATPTGFSNAVEAETDVPANVLRHTLLLARSPRIGAVVYNEQTIGAETTALLASARDAGLPTVGVAETLPVGTGYLPWIRRTVTAIARSVRR